MKQLFLLSFFFIVSCNQEEIKNTATPESTTTTSTEQKKVVTNYGDPYFIETTDTISQYGPHNITRNILQDKTGKIWFATWQGIMCYDGKVFTNFTLKENLRHYHMFTILEDKNGNIWFGSINGGAYKYDARLNDEVGQGKSFTLFTTAEGLVSDLITSMLEDQQGNIWFGTDKGVSKYDGKAFKNFDMVDGLSGNSVNSMMQDKTGKIWFGTNIGVSLYDGGYNFFNGKLFTTFKNANNLSFNNARSIIQDKTGNILIGTQDGLTSFNPTTNKQTDLASNFIGYIFEDKAGNIWLSGDEPNTPGMTLSKYDGKSFNQIYTNDNQVFGVTEDTDGNIWFGTAKGVCRYKDGKFEDFHK